MSRTPSGTGRASAAAQPSCQSSTFRAGSLVLRNASYLSRRHGVCTECARSVHRVRSHYMTVAQKRTNTQGVTCLQVKVQLKKDKIKKNEQSFVLRVCCWWNSRSCVCAPVAGGAPEEDQKNRSGRSHVVCGHLMREGLGRVKLHLHQKQARRGPRERHAEHLRRGSEGAVEGWWRGGGGVVAGR